MSLRSQPHKERDGCRAPGIISPSDTGKAHHDANIGKTMENTKHVRRKI
jgi:hypothetical protein